jgi:uncharacterized membrane protein YfcA
MDIINYLIIALSVLFGAWLTFFSGFGLGTILLPVFSLYFPIDIAIAATAIVHFSNNVFKFGMVYKHIHWPTLLRFGFPAMVAALLGALLLNFMGKQAVICDYVLFNKELKITTLKLVIGGLMLFFALFELIPKLSNWKMDQKYMPLGGLLSGFFGGISGHQGAFRSVFLTKTGLSKEEFIGTSNAIALVIDITRITVYATTIFKIIDFNGIKSSLLIGIAFAFIGSYFGKRLLSKTTIKGIQRVVGVLLLIIGSLFCAGIL